MGGENGGGDGQTEEGRSQGWASTKLKKSHADHEWGRQLMGVAQDRRVIQNMMPQVKQQNSGIEKGVCGQEADNTATARRQTKYADDGHHRIAGHFIE